jgi:hypothetical protein
MVLDGFSKTQKLGMVGLLATIALVAIVGKDFRTIVSYRVLKPGLMMTLKKKIMLLRG